MRVRFLGAIGSVTGSCSMLTDEKLGFQALVDCGMIQGEADLKGWNQGKFPFKPKDLKYILLTHAHLDHCGMIPMLYKKGFKGQVLATKETGELTQLILEDAVRQAGCSYHARDVKNVVFREPSRALEGIAPIHQDVFVSFYRTSHILGAVAIRVAWGPPGPEQKSITFSGDLGPVEEDHEQLPLNRFRLHPWPSDYAVVESTYGGRVRPPEEEVEEARFDRLRSEMERAVSSAGLLVIPAFAVDRTQQILLDLSEIMRRDALGPGLFASLRVVLHAKLAAWVGDAYRRGMRRKTIAGPEKVRPYWMSKALFRRFGLDRYDHEHERAVELYLEEVLSSRAPAQKPEEVALLDRLIPGPRRPYEVWRARDRAPTGGPGILLTGSGMCDGGPIIRYLPDLLQRTDVTLAFTGYLSGGTLGARIMDLERVPSADRERLSDPLVIEMRGAPRQLVPKRDVRCRIVRLKGYSAHADQASLTRWIVSEFGGKPAMAGRVIFLNHGNDPERRALKDAIARRAAEVWPAEPPLEVHLPDSERWFDLESGQWVEAAKKKTKAEIESAIAALQADLATLA